MKKVYVNEERCLGCHICEYYCAFAHSGKKDMVKAFLGADKPLPHLIIEEGNDINFAVSCRHCKDPLCIKSCITGAMQKDDEGRVFVDENRCVGCYTCILICPFGSVAKGAARLQKNATFALNAASRSAPNNALTWR